MFPVVGSFLNPGASNGILERRLTVLPERRRQILPVVSRPLLRLPRPPVARLATKPRETFHGAANKLEGKREGEDHKKTDIKEPYVRFAPSRYTIGRTPYHPTTRRQGLTSRRVRWGSRVAGSCRAFASVDSGADLGKEAGGANKASTFGGNRPAVLKLATSQLATPGYSR